MLRALVVLMLLANALFFAWTQGWLAAWVAAPMLGERDPARLAAQLRPETISVLTPRAASAALQAARAASIAAGEGEQCVQLGPYADSDGQAVEQQLIAAGVSRESIARRDVAADAGRYRLRVEQSTPAQRLHLRALNLTPEPCSDH
jgi:hypothetical protein